jgi:uncharacterized protein (TIGR03382 family)
LQNEGFMRSFALALALVAAAPTVAAAHIQLSGPLPRTLEQKQPNCGLATSTRSANPTVYAPGETITVSWNETIDHPGHYRIMFDVDGEDGFPLPVTLDDQFDGVLANYIPDMVGGAYTQEVTLPDLECENCTLQLIQVMKAAPPFTVDDIYFQCADIALRVGGGPDAGPGDGPDAGPGDPGDDDPGNPPDAVGGCSAGAGAGGPATLVVGILAGALGIRRRRRGEDAHRA